MTSDTIFHAPTPSPGGPPYKRLNEIGLGLVSALLLVGSVLFVFWALMAGPIQ